MGETHWGGLLAGTALITVILWEAFETIIFPRQVTRRVRWTRAFYRATWTPWRAIRRRFPPEGAGKPSSRCTARCRC